MAHLLLALNRFIAALSLLRFVSALHSPSAHPHLLLTAGGDPDILIFNHITGHLIHRVPILEEYRKNRVVRSGLRYFKGHKGKGKGKGKGKADEVEDAGAGAGEEGEMSGIQETGKEAGTTAEPTEDVGKAINEGKIENLTEEEWAYSPDGWMLPAGEGLCVGKIESFGDWAVYFTEGSKAIHSFRIPTTSEERGQNCQSIITHGLPSPVLDFVLVPRETTASAATSSQTILISTDPAWSQRVDGGKALHGVDANASGRQKDKGPRAAGEENLGEQEIEKLGMNGFKMVEISGVDGSVSVFETAFEQRVVAHDDPSHPLSSPTFPRRTALCLTFSTRNLPAFPPPTLSLSRPMPTYHFFPNGQGSKKMTHQPQEARSTFPHLLICPTWNA